MISKADYLGKYAKSKDLTPAMLASLDAFLPRVNRFIAYGIQRGKIFLTSPYTKTQIATQCGGWRPPESDCPSSAALSSHKICKGLDLFDGMLGDLGAWLLADKEAQEFCKSLGIHFEHPSTTNIKSGQGHTCCWLHITDRAPPSGNLFFYP